MSELILPNQSQSLFSIGRNGTGKSRAAVWHLSLKDFETETWMAINHKGEEFINGIPGAQFLQLHERPEKPGLYIYQPRPGVDDDAVTELLWWAYKRGNVGIYIDEGYMIDPRNDAMTALYTQGRSKKIPIITLSQRPSMVNRFAISEADFFQVFYITDKRDRKTLSEFIPIDFNYYMGGKPRLLREYHSIYHVTRKDITQIMLPVPSDEEILETFREKLMVDDEIDLPPLENKSPPKIKFL